MINASTSSQGRPSVRGIAEILLPLSVAAPVEFAKVAVVSVAAPPRCDVRYRDKARRKYCVVSAASSLCSYCCGR